MEPDSRDQAGFFDLDPDVKHCLVDTMVLLPICDGDPDVTRDTKRELNNATLVLLSRVVGEAAYKRKEMEGGGDTYYEDFASLLSSRLESAGIAFKFTWFNYELSDFCREMINDKTHPNLSKVDYALLCAAMERPDMDVMTDDRGLIGSIRKERGPKAKGKIRSVTLNHRKRRGGTAKIIQRSLAKFIPKDTYVKWRYKPRRTEFLIGESVAAYVEHSDGGVHVDLSPWVKNGNEAASIQSELGRRIRKFFTKWKPASGTKSSAHGKNWYVRRRDDDGYY